MAEKSTPICIIGAGGIVKDAHLPAYKIGGFTVSGIVNRNRQKAETLAVEFNIPHVYETVEAMVVEHGTDVIYDYALPASETVATLRQLPDKATVLIQKPLGESIEEARTILDLAHEKQLNAGVNFQLRFAPNVTEAKKMIREGVIGTLTDIEVYVNVYTPWNLWSFLFGKPRMEINYHSVHYIDLIRSFLGNPDTVYAKTFKHPDAPELASVKSTILMDYGAMTRAVIHTNHHHDFGYKHQGAHIKIEGTRGVIKMSLGVLIDYPQGVPDTFEYAVVGKQPVEWQSKQIEGTWFPHAFIGTMQQMMDAKGGRIIRPENAVDDAFETMRCVEAAYISSARGGVLLTEV